MDQQDNPKPNPVEAPKPPAGYKIESMLLLESTFSREVDIEPQFIKDLTSEVDIKSDARETTPDNKFAVIVKLHFRGMQQEKQVCNAIISMIGAFEKYGEPALTDDKFKAVNAPAIIYPFIREHLYSLCLKAGLANVLLPTINFKP
jgi:preprotein translocase subunit SecB